MIHRKCFWLLLALAALLPASCAPQGDTIQGCGATFPAPLYKRWFLEYYLMFPDVRVNYQAVGSGAGVRQFEEGLVHFGATDEAVKPERLTDIAHILSERERRPVELIQIPLTSGSVAVCYNLPGKPQLKLARKVYVGMVLGLITFWDDPAIKATNPDVALPHLEITFVRRADSGGTTFVFTNHLNSADPRWQRDNSGPGPGKTVQWPVGIGGKGNSGVAALIEQTPGAFGYLETGYAELVGLPMAALENRTGHFVEPNDESSRAGLRGAKFDKVLGAAVPDPTGEDAYPIVSFTWVICRKKYATKSIGDELKKVLSYCLEEAPGRGQALSKQLGYVPLQEEALVLARQAIEEINAD